MAKRLRWLETSDVSNLTLNRTLRPLITLTYWCGLLPPWCSRIKAGRVRTTLSWMGVGLTLTAALLHVLFQCVQLTIQFGDRLSIHSIMPNLTWLCPGLISFLVQVDYVGNARAVRELMDRWGQLERRTLSTDVAGGVGRVRAYFYGSHVFIGLATCASLTYYLVQNEEETFLLTYYAAFRRPGVHTCAVAFHMATIFCEKVSLSPFWNDAIPNRISN